MIPSVAADFRNAADAITEGNLSHDALDTTHVLIEIGRAWLDGCDTDSDMATYLRRIAADEVVTP